MSNSNDNSVQPMQNPVWPRVMGADGQDYPREMFVWAAPRQELALDLSLTAIKLDNMLREAHSLRPLPVAAIVLTPEATEISAALFRHWQAATMTTVGNA